MSDTKRYGKCYEIGCDAEDCTYNEDGCKCVAEEIQVDGKRAHSTDETCCRTFKSKSCC